MAETENSYSFARRLREHIAAEVPDAVFNEFDYGFGLGVGHPIKRQALLLVIPPKDDIGQDEYRINWDEVPKVIKWLKSGRRRKAP